MTAARYLIVNADDFGQSHGVNRGIIEAHERGIVTSASLMVRWPAAVEAAAYAKTHPQLSVGLHFDLGEWAFRDEMWEALYEVVPSDDAMAVAEEIWRQVAAFRELQGCGPTHIDSHQHVHRSEPVRSLLAEVARNLDVPLRDCNPVVRYSGRFYGQSGKGDPAPDEISVEALLAILEKLATGITELGCHPGLGNDLDTSYLLERPREVAVLCDRRVREAISAAAIELCSFLDLGRIQRGTGLPGSVGAKCL